MLLEKIGDKVWEYTSKTYSSWVIYSLLQSPNTGAKVRFTSISRSTLGSLILSSSWAFFVGIAFGLLVHFTDGSWSLARGFLEPSLLHVPSHVTSVAEDALIKIMRLHSTVRRHHSEAQSTHCLHCPNNPFTYYTLFFLSCLLYLLKLTRFGISCINVLRLEKFCFMASVLHISIDLMQYITIISIGFEGSLCA